MKTRLSGIAAGLCLALAMGAAAATTTPKPTAKEMTLQQQRTGACNQSAGDRTGDEREAFMKQCLRVDEPGKTLTPPQMRMKECNDRANNKSLSGDERKTFMNTCVKGGTARSTSDGGDGRDR